MPIHKRLLALSVAYALSYILMTAAYGLAGQVQLSWQDPNNNPAAVGGYHVYYWQAAWSSSQRVNVGKQTSYTLTNLEDGQTYHFTVTAYDPSKGVESAFSNEVTKTISAPPRPPEALNGLVAATVHDKITLGIADRQGLLVP